MRTLVLLALVGLGAQLVDGSLGMAYGVTSTTLLLAIGTNPAAASATVHLAEIGTTLASGAAHWRFGNVDWRVVLRIGVPGAIGAFAGATFLSWISTEIAKPVMSLLLLGLGLYVLLRFTFQGLRSDQLGKPLRRRFLTPLGLVAGFMDATGGGGWGPVGTPAILASGRLEPRKVVGSIDTRLQTLGQRIRQGSVHGPRRRADVLRGPIYLPGAAGARIDPRSVRPGGDYNRRCPGDPAERFA